ncbi:hypothetical protein [Flagellimonas sp. CMM7]|uniref:hypothetical protein n=1 Tax=Flagellimonas sp. CMM7 TaxID=2654676 RepID=UPI0013D6BA6E|nr:hypothetical protein [Flagellimonas sp. CMM7]UII79731.1 hypothetical protein LV704_18975 [Flagellimonas sp. CMM7]
MGGEGSMASAISSLKQNRALLKKRKLRNREDFITKERTQLNLKKSTPFDMRRIREKIAIRKKKHKMISLLALLLTIVLFGLGFLMFS